MFMRLRSSFLLCSFDFPSSLSGLFQIQFHWEAAAFLEKADSTLNQVVPAFSTPFFYVFPLVVVSSFMELFLLFLRNLLQPTSLFPSRCAGGISLL